MKDKLVSVIIPMYNSQSNICDCIDSVLRQNFAEKEILLIDDGSKDDTLKVIEPYLKKYNEIKLFKKQNGGASSARNLGVKHANGEYILFIDSDDLIEDNTIETIYKKVKDDNLDVLLFSGKSFVDGDINNNEWDGLKYKHDYKGISKGPDILISTLKNDDNIIGCPLMLIKKKILVDNNISFYEGIIAEDNLFRWELLLNSNRVEILNEPFYLYRIRRNSVTNSEQYMKLWTGFVISAYEADKYLKQKKEINNVDADLHIVQFIKYGIYDGFIRCKKSERKSIEAKKNHKVERNIIFKYKNKMGLKLVFYAVFPNLFYILRKIYKGN